MNGKTEPMPENQTCPQCGAALPAGALAGLCPACLLKQGAADSGTQPEGPAFEPPSVAELAQLFPSLEIIALLGKGGMGAVYKARQPALDRLVALKILPAQVGSGPGFTERFTREARALARLSHPNIVALYEFGEVHGLHYFIMEYVDGTNLRQLIQSGRLAPREALQIVPQICDALQYAHDQGIVHRDIKPENVLVDRRGHVKIADFGLAKLLGRETSTLRLTGEGQVMGTPHYMAPEQVEHPLEVDHRADIYALGVVFYEMLTGELPLGKFPPPSSRGVQVDVRLDEVVLRTLEKEPERRYQHASQVKSDVETIASGAPAPPILAKTTPMASAPANGGVLGQVKGPAIGLLITGILNWILIPLVALVFLLFSFRVATHAAQEGVRHSAGITVVPIVVILPLFLCSFIIFAAFKMKRLEAWWAAVLASILAILVTPGNIVGLPVGIWALAVLSRREVRQAFKEHAGGAPLRTFQGSGANGGQTWKWVVAVVGGLVTLGLAALLLAAVAYWWLSPVQVSRPQSIANSQPVKTVVAAPFIATLPQGTVELVALSHPSLFPEKWWRPNGEILDSPDFQIPSDDLAALPKTDYHLFVFRVVRQAAEATEPEWRIDLVRPFPGFEGYKARRATSLDSKAEVWWVAAPMHRNISSTSAWFGLHEGSWSDVAKANNDLSVQNNFRWPKDGDWQVKFTEVKQEADGVRLWLTRQERFTQWTMRHFALDTNGVKHRPSSMHGSSKTGEPHKWDIFFHGLSLASVQEFVVQAQPCGWAEFRNVSLAPSHITRLEIVEPEKSQSGNTPGNADALGNTPGNADALPELLEATPQSSTVLASNLFTAREQLSELLKKHTDNHPLVRAQHERIAGLERQLAENSRTRATRPER